MKYEPLSNSIDKQEILSLLANGTREKLMLLSLEVGQNWPDWKFAQDTYLKLAEHHDCAVRANACLGLAYIARTKGKLEKHLVKPVLFREFRENNEFKWRIEDSISDINLFLGWHIGKKARKL